MLNVPTLRSYALQSGMDSVFPLSREELLRLSSSLEALKVSYEL